MNRSSSVKLSVLYSVSQSGRKLFSRGINLNNTALSVSFSLFLLCLKVVNRNGVQPDNRIPGYRQVVVPWTYLPTMSHDKTESFACLYT